MCVDKKVICQDVITRIENQQFITKSGSMFGSTMYLIADLIKNEQYNESAQCFVNDHICEGCAKGGLMLAYVQRHNNMTIGELELIDFDIDEYWPEALVEAFGKVLLDEIEVAFECRPDYTWTDRSITNDRKRDLIFRYRGIIDYNNRLTAIMRDIIDDKF